MADIRHKFIPDAELHDPKGFGTASNKTVLTKDENGVSRYVDTTILEKALNFVDGNAAPPTEVLGAIYVLIDEGNGAVDSGWDGASYDDWVRFNGTTWVSYTPSEGVFCYNATDNTLYLFTTSWDQYGVGSNMANANLTLDANRTHDLAGYNLTFSGGTTIHKGADTLSSSSHTKMYDGDTTPNLLWDWKNNGDVDLHQAVNINTSNFFKFVNGTKEIGINSWNTHAYWSINNGTTTWSLISANSSATFNANEFGIANGSIVPVRIYNGTSVALGNVNKSGLNTSYRVQTAGDTLIGGDLHATDGTNIVQLDFNNYPKVKLGTPTQEWWLIEGDGTGSTFNNGDLYIYDSTGATKYMHFKQSSGDILLGTNLDLGNKRIENAVYAPSVGTNTTTASIAVNSNTTGLYTLTALATNLTIASPTGTPEEGQKLVYRFKDDGTSRTLTWNAIFRAIGVTLPASTTASKTLYVACIYNSTDTKWDVIDVKEEV